MVADLLNGFLTLIVNIANVVLAPINLLVANLIPDFSNLLTYFNYVLNMIATASRFIGTIIPPMTKEAIIFYLTFLVAYYTITISVHAFIKVYLIIQRIKFW